MSNNNATKKFSRRKAGNYGRPGSKAQKRTASKSARRFNAISVEDAFYHDANESAQRTFAERKGIDRVPEPFINEPEIYGPDEDILEIIKREKEEAMAEEIEREEKLFYNEKFGSDSEYEQQIQDGAGR